MADLHFLPIYIDFSIGQNEANLIGSAVYSKKN